MRERGRRRLARAAVFGSAAGHLLPSVATIPLVNRRIFPPLSGRSETSHVALTFDDGPDPASTPLFLDELARLHLKATFFLLGRQADSSPELTRRIVAEGHEVGVHGWQHRPHLLRTPWGVLADLHHAARTVRAITGVPLRFTRPPHGIVTGAGLAGAAREGLRPVLWTADGRDWQAGATPESVSRRIAGQLAAGGVVLLHDSDIASAPQAWRSALGALPALAELSSRRGWRLGPLRDHWR